MRAMRRSCMRVGMRARGADPVTVTTLAGSWRTTTFLRADGTFASASGALAACHDPQYWRHRPDHGARGHVITTGTIASARLPARIGAVGPVIDGGGSVITTGVKGFVEVPFAGTITAVTLLSTDAAATAGSIVRSTCGMTPIRRIRRSSVTASRRAADPERANKSRYDADGLDNGNRGGDVLGFSVTSAATVTRVQLTLTLQAS